MKEYYNVGGMQDQIEKGHFAIIRDRKRLMSGMPLYKAKEYAERFGGKVVDMESPAWAGLKEE